MSPVWRFLWANGVGQNITASALLAAAGLATGWMLRGRFTSRADQWIGRHLDTRHALLHEKLDRLIERQEPT